MYGFPTQGCQGSRTPFGGGFSSGFPGTGVFGGPNAGQAAGYGNLMIGQMAQMMGMMAQLLQQFGLGGAGGSNSAMMPSQAGFGGSNTGGVSDFLGGGGGGSAGGGVSGADASAGTGNTQAPASSDVGAGSKILEIGDSHTVGTFGHDLDAKLRGTGAQVSTYASAGANPSDFVNGTGHKYGYWEKGADGKEKNVGYGSNAAPPKLESLIEKGKPTMLLVNLGANFRGGNPRAEVDKIGAIAKKHNIPLVWVGPPKNSQDSKNPASIQKFDQEMADAVAPYGKYIASSGFTPKYAGGDGTHYGGSEGTKIAHQWASGVFGAIVGK